MPIPVAVMRTGTAALPGLAVLADLDTGLYAPASNSIAVAARGLLVTNFVGAASAVNSLKVTNSATGSPLLLEAVGSDTDVGIKLLPKGAGQVQGAAGTAALPGYTVTGDLDTGLYFPAANSVALTAKGVVAFKVVAASGTPLTALTLTTGATGVAPILAADGETNVGFDVEAKGSGVLSLGITSTGLVRIGTGSAKVTLGFRANTDIDAQNGTPTIAQLLGGIITHTSVTGAGTLTVPTGTATSSGIAGVTTGDSFDVHYLNDGTQTVTITAGASGSTILGTAAITTGKSCTLRFVCTGANTWSCYVVGIS